MKPKRYWLSGGLIGFFLIWIAYFIYKFLNPDSKYPQLTPMCWEGCEFRAIGYLMSALIASVSFSIPFAVIGWIYGKVKNRNKQLS
jgi:hypothetical protein